MVSYIYVMWGHSMEYSWEFYWVGRFNNVRSGGFNMWDEKLIDDLSSAMAYGIS